MMEKLRREMEADQEDYATHFSPGEWLAMDRERE